NEFEEAFKLYSSGIEYLMTGLKYEKNRRIHAAVKEKVGKYLQRAEDIKVMLTEQKKPKKVLSSKWSRKLAKTVKAHAGRGVNADEGTDDENKEEDEDTAKMKANSNDNNNNNNNN
ncbi:putative vacuolar sorting ATPase, partial [Reticulomyxa filosa]